MNLFKKSFILVLITCFAITLSGCTKKPDETIKNFFEAAKKTDFNTMSSLMKKEGNKGEFKYDNADQEKITKTIFSKVNYEIISSKVDGKSATAKTKVTSLDLPRIYGKVISDLMPSLFGAALSNETQNAQSQIMQSLVNAINDPNAPQTTTEVDIKLTMGDKGWLIEPTDDLLDAMTGNLSKAFKNNTSENSTVKPDSKLYNINDEAKIGKASMIVTKFELSEGKDYDKPKEGYIFAIVTLKKKNISNDTLSYNEFNHKIQNDKGQILDPSITSFGKRFGDGKLAGGGEVEGTITFEVPKDSTSLTLLYYPESEALLKFKLK